jgi:hypothetical protein
MPSTQPATAAISSIARRAAVPGEWIWPGGLGQREKAVQRDQHGRDNKVEHDWARQQVDPDDRASDDAGSVPASRTQVSIPPVWACRR